MSNNTVILLFSSPDKKGIINKITDFIFEFGGNIIEMDQYVDRENSIFFMRVVWELNDFKLTKEQIYEKFDPVGRLFNGRWKFYFSGKKSNIVIFVSKQLHCLQELLWRYELGDLEIDIKAIFSNHLEAKEISKQHNIPFYHFPINKENKDEQERKESNIIKELDTDTIILARYMQILSPLMVNEYPNKIINIHHSFLPAFVGGNPYKQAYERGVKIIGATSHFVTEELDQGPIIHQDVIRITHRDNLEDIKTKGRDLERIVLAEAIKYHTEHRILVFGRKTIIFK